MKPETCIVIDVIGVFVRYAYVYTVYTLKTRSYARRANAFGFFNYCLILFHSDYRRVLYVQSVSMLV